MKRPNPIKFGLLGTQAPLSPDGAYAMSADPDQPFTEAELDGALQTLILREAEAHRQREYARALDLWNYNNGGRL